MGDLLCVIQISQAYMCVVQRYCYLATCKRLSLLGNTTVLNIFATYLEKMLLY